MIHTIENEFLKVCCKEKGAELTNLYSKKFDFEYLWQAGKEWPKHSPILFPVVGDLKDKKIKIKGKEYPMTKHGFARDHEFEVFGMQKNQITYLLKQNQQTELLYPYNFEFYVSYLLKENVLQVSYKVVNTDNESLYFSVGAHPAFGLIGEKFEDNYLEFETEENAGIYVKNQILENDSQPFFDGQKLLPLSNKTFEKDALIFKDIKSKHVTLKNLKSDRNVKINFESPYFMIWTNCEKFVCLEPAWGLDDSQNSTGNIEEKEGINKLAPKQAFEMSYTIELN